MLINLLGFNLSWFGLILIGNSFIPLSLLWLGLHLYWCKHFKAEVQLILVIVTIGIVVDTALSLAGVLIFPEQLFIPLWLITLWATFAATIAHSLQFLSRSILLQVLVGFMFPPLSYLGGASLSSVELGYSQVMTYLILSLIWSSLLVLFFNLKEFFYGQVTKND